MQWGGAKSLVNNASQTLSNGVDKHVGDDTIFTVQNSEKLKKKTLSVLTLLAVEIWFRYMSNRA